MIFVRVPGCYALVVGGYSIGAYRAGWPGRHTKRVGFPAWIWVRNWIVGVEPA